MENYISSSKSSSVLEAGVLASAYNSLMGLDHNNENNLRYTNHHTHSLHNHGGESLSCSPDSTSEYKNLISHHHHNNNIYHQPLVTNNNNNNSSLLVVKSEFPCEDDRNSVLGYFDAGMREDENYERLLHNEDELFSDPSSSSCLSSPVPENNNNNNDFGVDGKNENCGTPKKGRKRKNADGSGRATKVRRKSIQNYDDLQNQVIVYILWIGYISFCLKIWNT